RGQDGRRPAGLGHAVHRLDGVVVEALCAVNAFGDIDHGGSDVSFDAVRALPGTADFDSGRAHTTIGLVVTNAALSKVECRILAQGAHDGLSRALVPPHTRFDGDGFVAAATGEVETHVDVARLLAVAAVADAIRATGSHTP
ncbi:MAG: P1 family peptidase, partial [Actinomycetia bacterium]|nr:P1 family peptidase [Actinomycetes bacterium]